MTTVTQYLQKLAEMDELAAEFEEKTGLSMTDFRVLAIITKKSQTLTSLAQQRGVSQQAVGKMVRKLKAGGYIDIEICKRDKRERQISLAVMGGEMMDEGGQFLRSVA